MTHSLAFGGKVVTVLLTDADDERCSGRHLDAVFGELSHLFGIVGHEFHSFHANVPQHFGCDGVVSGIGWMAEHQVCIERVSALVLEMVGLDFSMKSNPTSFLSQVQQSAPATLNDGIERSMKLRAAVASGAREDIAGQAFGMEANENLSLIHI